MRAPITPAATADRTVTADEYNNEPMFPPILITKIQNAVNLGL